MIDDVRYMMYDFHPVHRIGDCSIICVKIKRPFFQVWLSTFCEFELELELSLELK